MTDDNNKRQVIAWAFYDWANSAFATAVIAGFFPIFFKEFWSAGVETTTTSFRLGAANSIASLAVLCIAPVLGAIADQGALKKRLLLGFAALGIVMTACLGGLQQGLWLYAAIIYVLALIGFSGANVLYDALLVDVAPGDRLHAASGLGFGMGYLGGGLLFAFCVAMTLWPSQFGLTGATQAVQVSFVLSALWWAVFSLPLILVVTEPERRVAGFGKAVTGGLRELRSTIREIRSYRTVVMFLAAYWLYIDGVDTIIRMAVDYGLALGFTSTDLITALLMVQFIGFPAAIAFGWFGQKIGPKPGILIGLGVYGGITWWAYTLTEVWEFYGIAAAIGLVQGGVQALSRSLYARLIPREKAAEFFGFYNFLGKFAAVIGPVMMGWVAVLTGSTRISILSVLALFIAGGAILISIKIPRDV